MTDCCGACGAEGGDIVGTGTKMFVIDEDVDVRAVGDGEGAEETQKVLPNPGADKDSGH